MVLELTPLYRWLSCPCSTPPTPENFNIWQNIHDVSILGHNKINIVGENSKGTADTRITSKLTVWAKTSITSRFSNDQVFSPVLHGYRPLILPLSLVLSFNDTWTWEYRKSKLNSNNPMRDRDTSTLKCKRSFTNEKSIILDRSSGVHVRRVTSL